MDIAQVSKPVGTSQKGLVRLRHEEIADILITNPMISRVELAQRAGYTPEYISMITCSDAFQARLAARKGEMVDPLIKEEIEARFRAVTQRSLEVLQQKLAAPASTIPDALVLKAVEYGAKGMMVGGFAPAAMPTAPTAPAGDRLERLAHRLEGLIPDRRAGASDVPYVEQVPAAT